MSVLPILKEAALRGGETALHLLPNATIATRKGSGDFATTADIASQQAVLKILGDQLPGIAVIAEESDEEHVIIPPTFITVDPFDGTIIGSRGMDDWGVLVAYVEDYRVMASVLYQPRRGRMLTAERGAGCFLHDIDTGDSRPIDFHSRKSHIADSRLVMTFEVNYKTTQRQIERLLIPIVSAGRMLLQRSCGCAIGGIMDLAEAHIDVYANPAGGMVWDYAPAALVVEEAGGRAYLLDPSTLHCSPFRCETLEMGVIFFPSAELAEDILPLFQA